MQLSSVKIPWHLTPLEADQSIAIHPLLAVCNLLFLWDKFIFLCFSCRFWGFELAQKFGNAKALHPFLKSLKAIYIAKVLDFFFILEALLVVLNKQTWSRNVLLKCVVYVVLECHLVLLWIIPIWSCKLLYLRRIFCLFQLCLHIYKWHTLLITGGRAARKYVMVLNYCPLGEPRLLVKCVLVRIPKMEVVWKFAAELFHAMRDRSCLWHHILMFFF